MKAILLLCVVSACTTFDPIPGGVCGNGVVEPGEDCDTSDATCRACALVCSKDTPCPDGAACGIDLTCHTPGGRLSPSKAIETVSVNDFRITDVDRDGIGDFVGLSSTSLTVRRGDAVAPLQSSQSFVTPTQTGVINFGDLDNDGSLDFVIPTPDGLVAYTSKYGVPSPVTSPSTVISKDLAIAAVIPLRPTVVGVFLSATPTQAMPDPVLGLLILDFADLSGNPALAQLLCGGVTVGDFSASTLDVYDATGSGLTGDYVVSFLAKKAPCAMAIHLDPATGTQTTVKATVTTITPPNLNATLHRPVLAQLDYLSGDSCPYLVLSQPLGVTAYDGTFDALDRHCKFAAAPTAIPLKDAPTGSSVVGRVALKPQFPLTGADALVISAGLWAWVPALGTAYSLYTSARPLKGAVSGDIDGDGLTDGVLIPDGTDDMDLLMRYHQAGTGGQPDVNGYRFLRIDTAAEPSTVLLQDFDGNGRLDVEYTERSGDHTRMMIAYGTSDLLLPPVQVGAFDAIGSVVPLAGPSSADPLSLATDLMVTIPTGKSAQLAVLLGSPQRTMLPLLEPRQGNPPPNAPDPVNYRDRTTFQAAIIGDFAHETLPPSDPAAKQHLDVLAFATPKTGTTPASGWLIPNTSTGLDATVGPGKRIDGLVDCTHGISPTDSAGSPGALCADATYVAIPVMGHDVILGIDRYNRAGLADAMLPFTVAPATLLDVGDAHVTTLFAMDLDGDKVVEVVAAFRPGAMSSGAVVLCAADPVTGMPHDCRDVATKYVTAVEPSVTACVSATAATFAATRARDLVVACRDASGSSLFRIEPSNAYRTTKLATALAPHIDLIRAGDITGDGVDDLVMIHGDPGAETLSVLVQCTTRDAACVKEAP